MPPVRLLRPSRTTARQSPLLAELSPNLGPGLPLECPEVARRWVAVVPRAQAGVRLAWERAAEAQRPVAVLVVVVALGLPRAGEAQSPWVAALPMPELEPSRRK